MQENDEISEGNQLYSVSIKSEPPKAVLSSFQYGGNPNSRKMCLTLFFYLLKKKFFFY